MEARFACDSFCVGTVCNSPCFWCCLVLNYAMYYTRKFDRCPILNEINRGYLPQKGIKGILKHEDTEGHEVLFDRIYGMIGISGVDGGTADCLGT